MYDRNLGTEYSAGAHGADVMKIQTALQLAGFPVGAVDGLFGPQTKNAVQSFQSAHGLVIDGIVGPNTWSALMVGVPAAASQPKSITVPAYVVRAPGSSTSLFDSFGLSGNMPLLLGGIAALLVLPKLLRGKRKRR